MSLFPSLFIFRVLDRINKIRMNIFSEILTNIFLKNYASCIIAIKRDIFPSLMLFNTQTFTRTRGGIC